MRGKRKAAVETKLKCTAPCRYDAAIIGEPIKIQQTNELIRDTGSQVTPP